MPLYTTHEDVCRFEIEAELAQACPRRVTVPPRTLSLLAAALCAYVVAGLFAGAVALSSGETLWLSQCGRLQQAKLLDFETLTPQSTGEDSPISLLPTAFTDSADAMTGTLREDYAFVLGGKVRHGWTIATDHYAAPPGSGASVAELSAPARTATRTAPTPTVPVRTGWWMGRFVCRPEAMLPPAAQSAAQALAAVLALMLITWSAATR